MFYIVEFDGTKASIVYRNNIRRIGNKAMRLSITMIARTSPQNSKDIQMWQYVVHSYIIHASMYAHVHTQLVDISPISDVRVA